METRSSSRDKVLQTPQEGMGPRLMRANLVMKIRRVVEESQRTRKTVAKRERRRRTLTTTRC